MFKRLTWMTMGTGLGFGLALWCRRVVQARLRRYRPTQVTARLVASATHTGERLRSAASAGRHAMREREEQLRRHHAPSGGKRRHR